MSRWAMVAVLVFLVPYLMAAEKKEEEARKKLEGVWKGHVEDGATGHVITFTTTKVDGEQNDGDLGGGTYKLDLGKTPAVIDAKCVRGSEKGETYLGIYKIEGDTLKWCVAVPGSERPAEFATSGSNFLLVLKKQK